MNHFYWHVSNNETMPEGISNPININGFILRTGLIKSFSGDREIQMIFVPRLMSDLKNIDADHFQFGGIAMFKQKYSNKLTMSYGAMYNQELFGPYLVPLINLYWQISDRWSIAGLLPVDSKIKYDVNDQFNLGVGHFGLITSYKLGAPENSGDYMERQSIDVTMFARHKIVGNFYLEGRFGYTFGRTYAQYAADQKVDFSIPLVGIGDDRVQENVSFQDGWIAQLKLVYNVPIPGS